MPKYLNEYENKNNWNRRHYDNILVVVKRDENGKSVQKQHLEELAKASGKSVSRYIIDAVNAYAGETVLEPLDDESKKRKTE